MQKYQSTELIQETNDILNIGEYIIQKTKELGKGSYATVYEGYKLSNRNLKLAIKEIKLKKKQDQIDQKFLANVEREISILQQLDNINIIKIYDVIPLKDRIFVVLEYCPNGDLKSKMQERKQAFKEQEIKIYVIQLVNAFKEMVAKKIIHRDLKPANILIFEDCHIKLTDFGFAKQLVDLADASYLTRVGSPLYMSPQILNGDPFSYKCDVWSLGVIIYQLLTGDTPWVGQSPQHLYENIKKNKTPKITNKIQISDELKDIILAMLQFEESDRISWEELFEKSYLQKLANDNDIKRRLSSVSINYRKLQEKQMIEKQQPCCCSIY